MEKQTLTADINIDAKLFRKFAMFDAFRLRRRWKSPAIFAGLMLFFSAIAFAMKGRAEQAPLLGWVLFGTGLGFPAIYFLSYLSSVRAQIKSFKLKRPRYAYTLRLSESGVGISTEKEQVSYKWEQAFGAFRTADCTYLYITQQRAFLLPHNQVEGGADALWDLLKTVLPESRLHLTGENRPR